MEEILRLSAINPFKSARIAPSLIALQRFGVKMVQGDFVDLASLRFAMKDVAGAYFVHPVSPQLIEASVKFAQISKEATLKF